MIIGEMCIDFNSYEFNCVDCEFITIDSEFITINIENINENENVDHKNQLYMFS